MLSLKSSPKEMYDSDEESLKNEKTDQDNATLQDGDFQGQDQEKASELITN